MDSATLSKAMGGKVSAARYRELTPGMNECMVRCGATTRRRAAMLLAQLRHESGGLRWMQEIASGAAYEGRRDLGNTRRGDGRRFKGRGPIQLTGRANYTACSTWAHRKGYVPTPTFFVDHPDQLATARYGFVGVVWYWTVARPSLNRYADAGNVRQVSRLINGGTNGLAERILFYGRIFAMGDRILPTATQTGRITASSGPVSLGLPRAATVTLQRRVWTKPDGVWGPASNRALSSVFTGKNGKSKRARALGKRYGVRVTNTLDAPLVRAVQAYLNGLGRRELPTLAVDGVYGPATAAAVNTYVTRLGGGFR